MIERARTPPAAYQEHMFAAILSAVTLAAVVLDMLLYREPAAAAPAPAATLTVDLSRRS